MTIFFALIKHEKFAAFYKCAEEWFRPFPTNKGSNYFYGRQTFECKNRKRTETVIKLQYSRTSREFAYFKKLAVLRTHKVNLILYPLIYMQNVFKN